MPRYFFDTDAGENFQKDNQGLDLPSPEKAEEIATRTLTDMARDLRIMDGAVLYADVRNEQGELLYTASLVLNGRWVR